MQVELVPASENRRCKASGIQFGDQKHQCDCIQNAPDGQKLAIRTATRRSLPGIATGSEIACHLLPQANNDGWIAMPKKRKGTATSGERLHRLAAPRARHIWRASARQVDMSVPAPPPRPLEISAAPQNVIVDLNRCAIVVIDMQNDFCTEGGWVDHLGADYTPDRKPIRPLQKLLPALRKAGVPVIWVNWGNRADLANMPPNQIHLYKPHGTGIGLGDPLPGNGAPVLQKDSWAAAVVDELEQAPDDIKVDKYRISGFWDTPLDSILRNLDVRSIFFAGVNTDQCVLHSLTDANFLGYGCVLIEDCCATTSPQFCSEATIWNVKKCFGFVTGSKALLRALEQKGR